MTADPKIVVHRIPTWGRCVWRWQLEVDGVAIAKQLDRDEYLTSLAAAAAAEQAREAMARAQIVREKP